MSHAIKPSPATQIPLERVISKVCSYIAPNWPLDKMIAVNPFWNMRQFDAQALCARLAAVAGIRCIADREFWHEQYCIGNIQPHALAEVIAQSGAHWSVQTFVEELSQPAKAPIQWQRPMDLIDATRGKHMIKWDDQITYQMSQFFAAYFQSIPLVRVVKGEHRGSTLYLSWKEALLQDSGISLLLGRGSLKPLINQLPDDVEEVVACACEWLSISQETVEDFLLSHLLRLNGWSAYIQYRNFHQQENELQGLLAISVAWECIVYLAYRVDQPSDVSKIIAQWKFEQQKLPALVAQNHHHQSIAWLAMSAYEASQQRQLQTAIRANDSEQQTGSLALQAVFCIDVRSEVIRRALETQSQSIETFGFAGFFGLPINYRPSSSATSRPQLPGLLQSNIYATEVAPEAKPQHLGRQVAYQTWGTLPNGSFGLVETLGWRYAWEMLRKFVKPQRIENPMNQCSHHSQWQICDQQGEVSFEQQLVLAKSIVESLGIERFAPIVMLVGHGSHSTNNLHAAGLDCGACGGQTGEVNVRVLCQLLNDKAIRQGLQSEGIELPSTTQFVPALHNTTTDDIDCLQDGVPEHVMEWLSNAAANARKERLTQFDDMPNGLTDSEQGKTYQHRALDWSQVQPEWGLAGNHAFIIGPRKRTRGVALDGKVFLHDYCYESDSQGSLLEQLMTAPMIVTHWINMQYNASVSDNRKLGSGNKVLHNALENNIGVFEGNSGDLRIGLSRQSLHNGKRWMHIPERLSVYICAQQDTIEQIVERHEMLSELIDNRWLYLYSWDESNKFYRLFSGSWIECS